MTAVERSTDEGVTWQPVALPPLTTPLSGGSAPTNTVCWLAGRAGTVLLSTDGTTFRQVTKPADADLVSVRATDARSSDGKDRRWAHVRDDGRRRDMDAALGQTFTMKT